MKLKIVCIDDNIELEKLFIEELSATGHEVVFFKDPDVALVYIKSNFKTIAFIFCDYQMPNISGLEMRAQLSREHNDIPFVILTGYYDEEMQRKAMNLSVVEFLEKPDGFSKLNDVFNKYGKERVVSIEDEFMMVNSFLEESSPMLNEIEDLILTLESDPKNNDALKTYFRLLHTIKGTSACVGLNEISDYTHKYEDYVTLLQKGQIDVTPEVTDKLLEGYDVIKKLYKVYSEGTSHNLDLEELVKIFNVDRSEIKNKEEDNVLESSIDDQHEQPDISLAPDKSSESQKTEKVNVEMNLLDEFMEMSGKLTVIRNSILKTTSKLDQKYSGDSEVELLNDYLSEMHKISSSLQKNISEMRKTNLEGIFRPLHRVVRDICKNSNKKINFVIQGSNIRVDTILSKVLGNSLIHLIRNGLDHGLENIDERKNSGKDETGNLSLIVEDQGENIVVQIKDDGRGINLESIKKKAIENELYTESDLSKMSEQRLFQIIFESGFSTAQEVTDISGRGVGMDMVKSSIEEANGKIHIESHLNVGTTFKIILPIPKSVLILNSLMVNIGSATFSIPLDEIKETVRVSPKDMNEKISVLGDGLVLKHHEKLIPLLDIGKELSLSKEKITDFVAGKTTLKIVLSRIEGYEYGLLVDEVNDFEEVVVKKFSPLLKNVNIFGGSTIYGDEEIALFLSLKDIAINFNFTEKFDSQSLEEASQVEELINGRILTFTINSNEKKYAIPLEYINRLEVFDKNIIDLLGNTPVVRYRNDCLPLINLRDNLKNCERPNSNQQKVKTIVVNSFERSYGIIIHEISDIVTPDETLSENVSDDENILGTYYQNNSFISLIDIEKIILANDSHIKSNAEENSYNNILEAQKAS